MIGVFRPNSIRRMLPLEMRARPKQASIRFMSIAICVLVVLSNSQLFVLCIGQDGHVAIEAASSNCCGGLAASVSQEASPGPTEQGLSSNTKNCGSCVDISIGLSGIFKRPDQANPTHLASTTIVPVTISSSDVSGCQLAQELFAVVNPSLTCLRTIILLA